MANGATRTTTHRLTAREVATLTTPGNYPDGGGLYLQVAPGRNGATRSWSLRYTAPDGRRREMGLGRYPDLSLAHARAKATEVRRTAAEGVDPLEAREAERQAHAARQAAEANRRTFRECAAAYVEAHAAGWRNDKHAAQWSATLKTYAYPVFGDTPVADVTTELVLAAIEPIWRSKTETASRLRGRIERVLDWARARGLRTGENPARWRGHLDLALPARNRVASVRHHPALPIGDMPGFFTALSQRTGVGADCLAFLILTAARYGEAAGARWNEIDLEARLWAIPKERMKAGKPHRVPLSGAAAAILERRREIADAPPSGLVFASDMRRGAQLSQAAMSALLRRMGRSETVHGFRSSFRDWAAERTEFPREVAEAALAHAIGNAVEAAYRRSDLMEKRRALMAAWAEYCTGGGDGA